MTRVRIALVMMVKNEEKRLLVSLESVKEVIDVVYIYDTGSEDNTIQIAQDFCKKYGFPLNLQQGEFVDFATSRNVVISAADNPNVDFMLLLDSNDELRGGEHLRKFLSKWPEGASSGQVCQEWFSGETSKYFNTRILKTGFQMRYKGVVHEWVECQLPDHQDVSTRLPDNIVLYQNRYEDCFKSATRFSRDKVMLLEASKDPLDPNHARYVFYLAQTLECLKEDEDAYLKYSERLSLGAFREEIFHAHLRLGKIAQRLKKNWHISLGHFLDSFQEMKRAEPMLEIAKYYRKENDFLTSHIFAKAACMLEYPYQAGLFVERSVYDYERWHVMGIVSYYCETPEIKQEGRSAVLKAIEARNQDIDKQNLVFYDSLSKVDSKTKQQFTNERMVSLKKENPKITQKQALSKIKKEWSARMDKK